MSENCPGEEVRRHPGKGKSRSKHTAAWKALECLQNLEESSEVTERDPDIRWEKWGRGRLPRDPAAFF